jgi:uncharacterized YccA/Bax inhibitor family protein
MKFGESSNPALGKNALTRVYNEAGAGQMTINGTVNKMIISLLLVVISAMFSWKYALAGGGTTMMFGGVFGGLVVGLITVFKPQWAAITTPIYALLQGLFLGGISAYFNAMFPGIVFQAVGLTFGVAFALLIAYRAGVIKATAGFKRGIIAATGGVAIFYLVSIIGSFFGGGINLGSMGLLGIGIQLAIVAIAALNLVLDFDRIEQSAATGAPKIMEWYGAFGIMVTLVWLYLEILKLLALFAGNRD